jgi:hypothetical protein
MTGGGPMGKRNGKLERERYLHGVDRTSLLVFRGSVVIEM